MIVVWDVCKMSVVLRMDDGWKEYLCAFNVYVGLCMMCM